MPELLRPLGTISAAGLLSILDSQRIQDPPNHLVPDPWQVSDTSPAHENDRVFLQIVAFARNVRRQLFSIRETNPSDLPECGVRLLGGHRPNMQADPSLLRASLQQWGL